VRPRRSWKKIIAELSNRIVALEKKIAYRDKRIAKMKKGSGKVAKVMREYEGGKLHSGSKKGPEVTSRKQAIAIGLSEARKAGAKIPKKGK
jgi:hypothetical protein